MEEFDDEDDVKLVKKLNQLQELFCESIYEEVCLGGDVDEDDLEEVINYFAGREEFEKCVILKKYQKL